MIVGPTASGKSAVAMELARSIPAEIVNADSRQVYRGLAACTSLPSERERKAVPHHLYGFLDPDEPYSAGRYAREARGAVLAILKRGRTPIVAGGTGLYIRALCDGLAELPERKEEVRKTLSDFAAERGPAALHRRLAAVDPVSAEKIPAGNVQRVVRALEVHALTGRPLAEWHRSGGKPAPFESFFFGLRWDREVLKARISERCARILDGTLSEAGELLAEGRMTSGPAFQSLGLRAAAARLRGESSRKEFARSLATDTLRYAKRQITWFSRDARVRWLDLSEPFDPSAAAGIILREIPVPAGGAGRRPVSTREF